ncbi:MAG: UvrB/UvrC motif-containing protein [Candidatus Omnitrophica bacterium]|nr:UvrB/UvrC motif-containing protein [Candidatus Omnitrophota bacterium]
MKCEMCKKKDATVHLTEVINEKVSKLHLCEDCAKEKSEEMHAHFGLTDLLAGLMEFDAAIQEGATGEDVGVKCPSCGMTYFDFQKSGRLGCGNCYEIFSKELGELLVKIHGSNKHVGKMPFKGKEVVREQEKLQDLKNNLKALVQAEEFEKAALLRDTIKEIEDKLEGKTSSDDQNVTG